MTETHVSTDSDGVNGVASLIRTIPLVRARRHRETRMKLSTLDAMAAVPALTGEHDEVHHARIRAGAPIRDRRPGLTAGGGVDIGRAVVDARYTTGLTNVDAVASDAITIKNRTFSVMGGIRFGN